MVFEGTTGVHERIYRFNLQMSKAWFSSHMPPMHLRHGRRYCLGYCSDMRTEVADNIGRPSLYRRHAGGKALRWL